MAGLLTVMVFLGGTLFTAASELSPKTLKAETTESEQKEAFEIIDIEGVKLSFEERRSIPYLGMRSYLIPQYKSRSYEKILIVNNKIIGAIGYHYCVCHCDSIARIVSLGIMREYQKKGYGTYLMKHVLKEAEEQGVEKLTLRAINGSVPFYKKLGFKLNLASEDSTYMYLNLNNSTKVHSPSSLSSTEGENTF